MDTIRHTVAGTRLGAVTLVADGDAVTGLYFRHHVRRPDQRSFGPEVEPSGDPLLTEAADQLHDYLDRRRTGFDLPLRTGGDVFQEKVWALLKDVPYGTTTTYGTLAGQLGDRALAQRVGQAVGANPLCVFVPCHRVVGADGSLTGYAGGLRYKQELLELEEPAEVTASRLF
ncbi:MULTISPECIES: methylated-DNA--[protein]-cysteine S-methyltransferase [Kitasatospora]|uniref:Methylated-DNA--protein-cysteine methyltransferase n=1 Tax=Kitasatospora setae (strain ATCC 33774 / DSM 43861 / JCM 3304 / KCC A-0304 / NBRC 14216 / KM-6054) TaxID=452652 RepID=E4N3Z4_KITSK|nr:MULTISPECIES: methylated-DNA--[protein]-cysteine S-methyltransferase [Kitasatospora]BAJ31625.1 putative methylated-DNA--protein-cysteine methyltransferase [Kitasatospora setae KM-6054]